MGTNALVELQARKKGRRDLGRNYTAVVMDHPGFGIILPRTRTHTEVESASKSLTADLQ